MKSIKARLKHPIERLLVMDKPSSARSSSSKNHNHNRMNRSSTSRRNPDEDPADETTKHRFFWGNRRNSTTGQSGGDKGRSKIDLTTAGGKKKSPRPSAYTQTDRSKSNRNLNSRNTRCNSLAGTAITSRENVRQITGSRNPDELTARCSATHEGRKVLQERLMVQVDALFNMLFSASPFLQSFHERRKSTDLRMGGWKRNANGQNERIVTVTVALQANVGPKTAKVTETQIMRECSQPGQLYSIDVQSVNAEIPYADAFVVLVHFCLRATVEEYTDVLVFAQVKFLKSVWAVVKAFIEKNTYAGLEEFCQSLYSALLLEIKKR
ncbi:protein Aster-B [Drosophila takahashii]|uniref:protein Aster-B n=1 Tax=Drosophila takahashii TaxID=29030 RepID=UPI001CF83B3D|nr:protein Aster-B [Drosophila takahashii]